MAKVISIINYKGGVGKTTLTLQLGIGLATLHKKKVLMVDLDPQCSLSLSTLEQYYWADWLKKKGSIVSLLKTFYTKKKPELREEWIVSNALNKSKENLETDTPNLDLLPSHLDLPEHEIRLMTSKPNFLSSDKHFQLQRYFLLRNSLEEIRRDYDYILFDCPPNIYLIARSAIIASDYFLIPTIPDFISCYGIPFILEHIRKLQKDVCAVGCYIDVALMGIVCNRVKKGATNYVKEHQEHIDLLKDEYGKLLLPTIIKDSIGVAEILNIRKNIYLQKDKKSVEMAKDFSAFTNKVYGLSR